MYAHYHCKGYYLFLRQGNTLFPTFAFTMNDKSLQQRLSKYFASELPHTPTPDQQQLILKLSAFVTSKVDTQLFLLKGYAGTGKTTLVGTLINILPKLRMKSVLLAPTGRAAKVLSGYSGQKAFTIHKKIYTLYSRKDGSVKVNLQKNPHKNTLFFIDEASMIPDVNRGDSRFGQRSLLDDLLAYIYSGQGCKAVFIGDSAQLPPVGLDLSPALDTEFLRASFSLDIMEGELKDVVRQEKDSGILANATRLRNKLIEEDYNFPFFKTSKLPQIYRITGGELEEALMDAFNGRPANEAVVITRSNKRANIYNQEIRHRILMRHEELEAGDLLMVVKNNYFWLPDESKAGFIANGDAMEILRITGFEELYGFHFASATVQLIDYPEEEDLEVKLLLNTLSSESPSLTYDENQTLFQNVMEDYKDIPQKKQRMELLKKNPYFNALQVKFAYALTCHKTQGGQWDQVFVEQGFFKDDMLNRDYIRWLYTGLTRASHELFLVNFKNEFFEDDDTVFYYD